MTLFGGWIFFVFLTASASRIIDQQWMLWQMPALSWQEGNFGAIGFISIFQLTNPNGLLYILTIRRPWLLYLLVSTGNIYGRIIGLSFTVITNQLHKLSTKALQATRLLCKSYRRFSGCLRSIIFTLLQFTLKVIVTLLRMLFLGYTSVITSFPFTLFCTRTLDVLQRTIRSWQITSFYSHSSVFLRACHPFLASQLQQEIYKYCSQLYAESTKATYKMQHDTYLRLVNTWDIDLFLFSRIISCSMILFWHFMSRRTFIWNANHGYGPNRLE